MASSSSPRRSATLALALIGAVVLALLGARPALADSTSTVDFESGPALDTPVNDDYKTTNFVYWLREDQDFRPYRETMPAGVATHSGTVAGDLWSHCYPGEVDDPSSCEVAFSGTFGRLTHSASAIEVYVGLMDPLAAPDTATLTAYDAGGNQIAQSATPIGPGITTPLTVSTGAPNITSFDLRSANGGKLGMDDLTSTFPAGSVPDFSLTPVSNVPAVREGQTTDVPLTINRLNGSDGPLQFSVSGVPAGVTATVTPDPVTGTSQTATLHLTGALGLQRIDDAVITVTADPAGDGAVGPQARSIPIHIRANTNFELAGGASLALPPCAPVHRTITLQRDFAYTGTTTLSLDPLPAGVNAEIEGGTVIAPGGGFYQDRTLRVSRGTGNLPFGAQITVHATAPGYPPRTLTIPLAMIGPTAAVSPTTGTTPQRLQPGTPVSVTGTGFCAGTQVQVGSSLPTDVTLAGDQRSLTFNVPRTATSGAVTILPPGGVPYTAAQSMTIANFRGVDGFQFANYGWGSLSYDELTDLVGSDDMYITFNPCWPEGTCRVNTGVPDPLAYAVWGVLKVVVKESGGHCFGISRTIQELLAGKVPYSRFSSSATTPHELGRADGPGTAFGSFLDENHAAQGTAEFLHNYLEAGDSIAVQVEAARHELAAGRYPGMSMRHGLTEGHVITIFDIERQPDGAYKLYAYDNNRPQTPDEAASQSGHADAEVTQNVIDVNPAGDHWTYHMVGGDVWSGGNDGSLYTIKLSDIPDKPSLPGLADLDLIVDLFGSTGGAAVTDGQSSGAKLLPALDPHGRPGASGFVVAHRSAGTLRHTMRGVKAGSYSQLVAGPGFAGGVVGVPTAKGVTDDLAGTPKRGAVSFAGSMKRPLDLALAVDHGKVHRTASIATTAGAGGTDAAALGTGLSYTHSGPTAKVHVTLTSVAVDGGPVVFTSPALTMRKGERMTLKPLSWKTLARVRVTARRHGHRATSRVVRNRARFAGRVRVGKPALGHARSARVGIRFVKLPRSPVAGVVLRLLAGKRVVARKAVSLPRLRRGRRTVRWHIPARVRAGRYRLVANVLLAGGGATPGRRTATSARRVRIR